jgi:uncharacterized 2Fe-2S/4Fe-4S cluster protein (DUF4445 family)
MAEDSIRVAFPELGRCVETDRGNNLLAVMREAGIALAADCGGAGRCGKCRVIIDGDACLACTAHVMDDIEVVIPSGRASGDGDYSILVDYDGQGAVAAGEGFATGTAVSAAGAAAGTSSANATAPPSASAATTSANAAANSYAIAVDIGTTTVVGTLIDLATGRDLGSFAQLNAQIPYGADVISRIDTSLDDASKLSALITAQIDTAIVSLLAAHGIDGASVRKLVVAGNTAMSYILLGLPCRSLGLAPFKPAYAIEGPYAYRELFKTVTLGCDCDVLPYISAYVGGDLTAGLCALRGEDDFVLMDMGTNGEMLFRRGERLVCTATAAGPAFEGGSIECGLGSTRGAISSVWHDEGGFGYRTIGDAPATGICGSGILDLMAVLIREGFVDATGAFTERVEGGRVVLAGGASTGGATGAVAGAGDPAGAGGTSGSTGAGAQADASSPAVGTAGVGAGTPEVYFSQQDVRQYQLAKGAIRAGLEVLLDEMGGDLPAKVFLAGGFGQNLDPASAIATGLMPQDFSGRVIPIGNSSLSGAVKLCLNESARADVIAQIGKAQEINLATHRLFNDLFMEHMLF